MADAAGHGSEQVRGAQGTDATVVARREMVKEHQGSARQPVANVAHVGRQAFAEDEGGARLYVGLGRLWGGPSTSRDDVIYGHCHGVPEGRSAMPETVWRDEVTLGHTSFSLVPP